MKIAILVLCLAAYSSAQLSCDEGWTLIGRECYMEFQSTPPDEQLQIRRTCCDYPTAKAICERFGAHLVDIKSQEEQDNIRSWLESVNSTDVWMGMTSPTPGGKLFHSDNTPVKYFTWTSSEPGRGLGRNEPVRCVRMHEENDNLFDWSDRACFWQYGALCEKDPNKPRKG
ncbi:type-2 ice-structuring protein-like [Amphiura filiformis]|uniref:type-2 ice-structuring protein-like n=1 Tax=Amphiura filiformis TaxID=82378 RepID=UPI003B220581